jgi:hypothetical protein
MEWCLGVGVPLYSVSLDFNKSIIDIQKGKDSSNVLLQDISIRQTDSSQEIMDDLKVITQTQGTLGVNIMRL